MRDAAIQMNMTLPARNEVVNRAKVLRRVMPEQNEGQRKGVAILRPEGGFGALNPW